MNKQQKTVPELERELERQKRRFATLSNRYFLARLALNLFFVYFLVRTAFDISPLILQRLQSYAIEQAKQATIERLNPFR